MKKNSKSNLLEYGAPQLLDLLSDSCLGANCTSGSFASVGGCTNGSDADKVQCEGGGTPDVSCSDGGYISTGCGTGTDAITSCNGGTTV
ncbi:MAG: hypothetical protein HQ596_07080 [Candidatus Saganbacteria bacterium]|nr:hypothetical protein [Candidatus Saganbacteria bacterium]